jgi:hypothetical protein
MRFPGFPTVFPPAFFQAMCAAVCLSFAISGQAGGACTYSEARIAFAQGNEIRGQALMEMAARDGDRRAIQYLASVKSEEPLERSGDSTTVQLAEANNVTR